MEVRLEVDAAQLSTDIRELLGSLSDAKKEELAVTILTETLKSGETTFARHIGIDKALDVINSGEEKRRYYFNTKKNTLETVDGHYWISEDVRARFNKLVKQYATFYGYFQEVILDKMLVVAVERVEEMVRNSEMVNKAIDAAVQEIEGQFPKVVQAAMQTLFFNTLADTIRNQKALTEDRESQKELLGQIQERLDRNNVY